MVASTIPQQVNKTKRKKTREACPDTKGSKGTLVAELKDERGNKAAEDDGEGENVGGRNVGLESREGSTAARETRSSQRGDLRETAVVLVEWPFAKNYTRRHIWLDAA
jgi:hypothetical protein